MKAHTVSPMYRALDEAIEEHAGAGVRIPCRGSDADNWTSNVRSERERAVEACTACPRRVFEACDAYAAHDLPGWHVWAATDHTNVTSDSWASA